MGASQVPSAQLLCKLLCLQQERSCLQHGQSQSQSISAWLCRATMYEMPVQLNLL